MKKTAKLNIIDGSSLFFACDVLAERYGLSKVNINYECLANVLTDYRTQSGMSKADKSIICLSSDPKSEGQRRFVDMLEKVGYTINFNYFRNTYISKSPGAIVDKPITSLSYKINYILGLLNTYKDIEIVVITHMFEVYDALFDLQRRSKAKVGLMYFEDLLDYRWKNKNVPIFDLNNVFEDLCGIKIKEEAYFKDVLGEL